MFGQKNEEQHDNNQHQDQTAQVTAPQTDDFNPALPSSDAAFTSSAVDALAADTEEIHDELVAPATVAAVETPATPVAPNTNDLLDIKQQALSQLTPLVGHLEQSPEEKFRTTMMMIQASDNQELVGEAFKAAQAITDEKAKAQALLDIVNEINYFTQHHNA